MENLLDRLYFYKYFLSIFNSASKLVFKKERNIRRRTSVLPLFLDWNKFEEICQSYFLSNFSFDALCLKRIAPPLPHERAPQSTRIAFSSTTYAFFVQRTPFELYTRSGLKQLEMYHFCSTVKINFTSLFFKRLP